MNLLPAAITTAIDALSDLPGIGTRSAERLVFALLKNDAGLDQKIGQALLDLKKNVHECAQCCHLAEEKLCPICQSPTRSADQICVVESPMDVIAIERTHGYHGLYHVLHGVISPLDRVSANDIRIAELIARVNKNPPAEIILALAGTTEAETTAMQLSAQLHSCCDAKISRLARGIPSGGDLDYLDASTLSRAMLDRREL